MVTDDLQVKNPGTHDFRLRISSRQPCTHVCDVNSLKYIELHSEINNDELLGATKSINILPQVDTQSDWVYRDDGTGSVINFSACHGIFLYYNYVNLGNVAFDSHIDPRSVKVFKNFDYSPVVKAYTRDPDIDQADKKRNILKRSNNKSSFRILQNTLGTNKINNNWQ